MDDTNYTLKLPSAVYTCEQTRRLDQITIEQNIVSGFELMSRAAKSSFQFFQFRWPEVKRVIILCGAGNNAGDAYLFAHLACLAGIQTEVYWIKVPRELSGDALKACHLFQDNIDSVTATVQFEAFSHFLSSFSCSSSTTFSCDSNEKTVIVDGLLGTGIQGALSTEYAEAIQWINANDYGVFSLDIPSGLSGDSGPPLGDAVKADVTITFIGVKRGLCTGEAVDYVGQRVFAGLGVPDSIYADLNLDPPHRLDWQVVSQSLPKRKKSAHKGHSGRAMLIGGAQGFSGAIILAGEATARTGTGLTYVITQPETVAPLLSRVPEVMVSASSSVNRLDSEMPLISNMNCIALGPGLGQSDWSEQYFQWVLKESGRYSVAGDTTPAIPVVCDADGLNLLANASAKEIAQVSAHGNWILTPHPGEAARLLNCSITEIQQDRFRAAQHIQQKYQAIVVLKGAGTVIATQNQLFVAEVGNSAMASGGMGDVLTGIITGLIAQGVELESAVKLAVMLHGLAAEECALEEGLYGVLASDLIPYVRKLMNQK